MTVYVGTVSYRALNLGLHLRAAPAVHGAIPKAMFALDGKLWKFANVDALLQALAALHEAGWTGAPQVPPAVAARLVAPKTAEDKAGTVVVGATVYATPHDLLQIEALSHLTQGAPYLGTAAFRALANDTLADAWRFASWAEVAVVLQHWTPQRPESILGTYDPTNMTTNRAVFDGYFGNCGAATKQLIGRVQDLGGQLELVRREPDVRAATQGGNTLKQILLDTYAVPVLIHVTNPIIHEFVIELLPGGQAFLQQGYESGYDALWWAGLKHGRLSVPNGGQRNELIARRDVYGKGKPIPLKEQLLGALEAFMAINDLRSASNEWSRLPFLPGQKLVTEGVPSWDVRVWQVRNPLAVVAALSNRGIVDQHYSGSLTMAVLTEAEAVAPAL